MVLIPNSIIVLLASWGAVSLGGLLYHRFLAHPDSRLEIWEAKYKLLQEHNQELQTQLDKATHDLEKAYELILEKLGTKVR